MTYRSGRRRGRGAALAIVLALLVTACGGGADGDDDGDTARRSTTAPVGDGEPAPDDGDGEVTADAVETLLLEDDSSLLRADETAGAPEARCVAERWVRDMTPEELDAVGLPDDVEAVASIISDEDAIRRFLAPLFECLDMRAFIVAQLGNLPPDQAQCVAAEVVADEDVRVLFLIGTTDGSVPAGGQSLVEEGTAQLDAYTRACA